MKDKFEVFGHHFHTLKYIAEKGGYKVIDSASKGIITSFLSSVFNVLYFGSAANKEILDPIEKKLPLLALPLKGFAGFDLHMAELGFAKFDDVEANVLYNLQ
jgi:hypothetical protein